MAGLDDVLKQKTTSQAADGWRKAENDAAGGNADPGNLSVNPGVQAIAMQEAPEVMGALVEGLAGSINKAFEVHTNVTNAIKDIEYQRVEYLRSVENSTRVNTLLQQVNNARQVIQDEVTRQLAMGVNPEEVQLIQQERYEELRRKTQDTLNNTLLSTAAGKENDLRQDTYRAVTNVIGDANARTSEHVYQFQAAKLSAVVTAQASQIQSDVLTGNITPEMAHAQITSLATANPTLNNDLKFQASVAVQHQAVDVNNGLKMLNRGQFNDVLDYANNTKNYLKDDDRQRFITMANAGIAAQEAAKDQAAKDWLGGNFPEEFNNMIVKNGTPSKELMAAFNSMTASQKADFQAQQQYGKVYTSLKEAMLGMTLEQRKVELDALEAGLAGMPPGQQRAYRNILTLLKLEGTAKDSLTKNLQEMPGVNKANVVNSQIAAGITPTPLSNKEAGDVAAQVAAGLQANDPKVLVDAIQTLRNIPGEDTNGVPIATHGLRQLSKVVDKSTYALVSAAMLGDMSLIDMTALMEYQRSNGTSGISKRQTKSDGVPTLAAALSMIDGMTGKPKAGVATLEQRALFIDRLTTERGAPMHVEGNAILSSLYEMGVSAAQAKGETNAVKLAAAGMAKVKQVLDGVANVVEVQRPDSLQRNNLRDTLLPGQANDMKRGVASPNKLVFPSGVVPTDPEGMPDAMNSYWRQTLTSGAGTALHKGGTPLIFTGTVPKMPAQLQAGIAKAANYPNSPFKPQLDAKINAYAKAKGVDPNLIKATFAVESGMKDLRVKGGSDGSPERNAAIGSLGLSQMTVNTRKDIERRTGKKYDLTTVEGSVEAAVDYYALLGKSGNTKDPVLLARMWNGQGADAEKHANLVAGAYNALVQKGGNGVTGGSQVLSDINGGKGRVVVQQRRDGLVVAFYQAWGSDTKVPIIGKNGKPAAIPITAIVKTRQGQ